jgi:hypothetical protein
MASMASPSNKCHFNDDEGLSSTPLSAPLRRRVGDEVGAVVPPTAEKVVSVTQDDSGSNGEGSSSDYLGSDDSEVSGNDDGENKAMCIPFRTTPYGMMRFKCPICLGEEYDSEAKVVHHALEVIKQDVETLDVVEWHRQVLQSRG